MRALAVAAFAAATVALTVPTSTAHADDDDVQCEQVRPGQVVCTDRTVYGRRHAPSSYYLLGRARVDYEAPPLVRRDMPRRVAATVRRAPF